MRLYRRPIKKHNWAITLLPIIVSGLTALLVFIQFVREEFFYDSDIKAYPDDEIYMKLNYGKFDIYHFIDVRNTGHKQGTINKMLCYITYADDKDSSLKVLSEVKYFQNVGSPDYHPAKEITVNAESIMSTYFQFKEEFSDAKRDELPILQYKAYREVIDKKRTAEIYNYQPEELSQETWEELLKFIYSNDIQSLKPGKYYYLLLMFKSDEDEPFTKKAYNFDISAANIIYFQQQSYGYFVQPVAPFQRFETSLPIKLNEIYDIDTINQIYLMSQKYESDYKDNLTPIIPKDYDYSLIHKVTEKNDDDSYPQFKPAGQKEFYKTDNNHGLLTVYTYAYAGATLQITNKDSTVIYSGIIHSNVGYEPMCGQKEGYTYKLPIGNYLLRIALRHEPQKAIQIPVVIDSMSCQSYVIGWSYEDGMPDFSRK